MSIAEISEELDETCLQIFDNLENLYEAQDDLEQALKEGYLGISRTRYNLGVNRVSTDQFIDADLLATRTVNVKSKNCTKTDELKSKSISSPSFELNVQKRVLPPKENDEVIDKGDQNTITSVRQRKNVSTDSDKPKPTKPLNSKEKGEDSCNSDDKKDSVPKLFNPINLFGILVPQHLRKAQNSFEKAIELTVKIANFQSELNFLRQKYANLKKEKSKLMGSLESES